jgi:cadmium resistance protein CadD (predicted permease)
VNPSRWQTPTAWSRALARCFDALASTETREQATQSRWYVTSVTEEISLVLLSVALFASTNLDDIFVLVGFLASPSFRGRDVIIGQFLGIAALMVPREVVGLLGIAPVVIGVRAFRRARDTKTGDGSLPKTSRTGVLAVAVVTIANGGDNLAAYVPVFARRPLDAFLVIGLVFAAMTGAWCWLAHFLVSHPQVGAPVRRYGGRVFPWVLVAIGLNVLWSNAVIQWVARRAGVG